MLCNSCYKTLPFQFNFPFKSAYKEITDVPAKLRTAYNLPDTFWNLTQRAKSNAICLMLMLADASQRAA